MKCNFLEERVGLLSQQRYDAECAITDRECCGKENCILWQILNK